MANDALEMPFEFDQDVLDELEEEFINIAFTLFWNGNVSQSHMVVDRRIRAWCGCSPLVIAKAWSILERTGGLPEHATKDRMLWGLHLMKSYNDEITSASTCGAVDETTFRRWAWYFIEEISYLTPSVVRCFALACLLAMQMYLTFCRFCGATDTRMILATPV